MAIAGCVRADALAFLSAPPCGDAASGMYGARAAFATRRPSVGGEHRMGPLPALPVAHAGIPARVGEDDAGRGAEHKQTDGCIAPFVAETVCLLRHTACSVVHPYWPLRRHRLVVARPQGGRAVSLW